VKLVIATPLRNPLFAEKTMKRPIAQTYQDKGSLQRKILSLKAQISNTERTRGNLNARIPQMKSALARLEAELASLDASPSLQVQAATA
jgi:peptidoglycan hydrolase CwlO-like protein